MKKSLINPDTQQECCHNHDCENFATCDECKKDFAENFPKSNAQVLSELLGEFTHQEDFIQEQIAEYIACPKKPYDCEHYGDIYPGCIACKIQWLKARWAS